MILACPKEIKNNENRVGLTPNAVTAYKEAGHTIYIEKSAGLGSAIKDEEYRSAGAEILDSAEEIWAKGEMIVKVKEPLPAEYALMRENQIVYTYFHFAASEELTDACLKQKIISLAYETVQEGKSLPLLKPMSEVAGRMSSLMGAFYSAKTYGGRGHLPMGVTGVAPAEVLVLGGGTVGAHAAIIAAGLGARVTILDINLDRLEFLDHIMPANVRALYNDRVTLESSLRTSEIIIGAVLVPGAKAPKLIRRDHLKLMMPGTVLVDVAIDQGGCFATSHPTTHSDPIFEVDGIIHYCVANMPGAYARTATFALNNATIRYGLMIANKGVEQACRDSEPLKLGLNTYKGALTSLPVAQAFGMKKPYRPVEEVLR